MYNIYALFNTWVGNRFSFVNCFIQQYQAYYSKNLKLFSTRRLNKKVHNTVFFFTYSNNRYNCINPVAQMCVFIVSV